MLLPNSIQCLTTMSLDTTAVVSEAHIAGIVRPVESDDRINTGIFERTKKSLDDMVCDEVVRFIIL